MSAESREKFAGADLSSGGSGDSIDTHGHTVASAEVSNPELDASLPAASQVTPTMNQEVRAETADEVDAETGL